MKKTLFIRLSALITALFCFAAFAACSAPAEPAPDATATLAPDAKVYQEETLDISQLQYLQEVRTLASGDLAGIGSDLATGAAVLHRLGDDGKSAKSVPLTTNNDGNVVYYIDDEGGVYIHESALPEVLAGLAARGGDSSGDDADSGVTSVVRHLDSDGKELSRVELEKPPTSGTGANTDMYADMVFSLGIDEEAGRVYENMQSQVRIYDLETGEYLKTVDNQAGGMDNMVVMGGGDVCEWSYGEGGVVIRRHDPVTGEEKWSLNETGYPNNISYSAADGKLYVRLDRRLVGIDENGERETLLELSDFSVMSPFTYIIDVAVGKEGMVYCLLQDQSNLDRMLDDMEKAIGEMEATLDKNPDATIEELNAAVAPSVGSLYALKLVRLYLTEAANIPPVQEITVSILSENSTLSGMASAFHAANPGYRVKFKEMIPQGEMLQMQRGDIDYSELIQRVNTEIISGKAADVLTLAGLPYESYARKNILEDLLPYMENDPEFNLADYRANIFDAMKMDGKLYALPTNFSVSVLPSKQGVLTKPELTAPEFFDKLFSLKPEEIPRKDAATLFGSLFQANVSQFTDASGNINLEAPEFIAFLDNIKKADELYKSLPSDASTGSAFYVSGDSSSMAMPMSDNDQIFAMDLTSIDSYSSAPLFKQQFGKEYELRFTPSFMGANVKGFSSDNIYGINRASANKDAAWQFLKFLISEGMQSAQFANYGCPVNLRASERMVKTYLREADLVVRQFALQQRLLGSEYVENNTYLKTYIENQFNQSDGDKLEAMMSGADTMLSYDTTMLDLAMEELDPFLKGQKSANETAKTLQSRLSMYLSEQQ